MISTPQPSSAAPQMAIPVPQQWWGKLTTPLRTLKGEEWRQARLLLSLVTVAVLLSVFAVLYQIVYQMAVTQILDMHALVLPSVLSVMFGVAYALGRSDRFRWGSILFVTSPTVAISLLVILFPPAANNTFFIYYILLSTVFASLLLGVRETMWMAIANLVIAAGLIVITPTWNPGTMFDEVLFNVIVPSLLVVSALVRQQYLDQINAQIVELEKSRGAEHAAREAAERADQVKSAFLASMSHELRTPLNSVINFTKFVARGAVGPVNEKQENLLNKVVDSGKHLHMLINDVLDMSKIEAGSLTLLVEDNVDLSTILETVVMTGRALLTDKPVTIVRDIDLDLPMLRGDRQRILQIMLNIMSNACKFTEEGTITLKARQVGEHVQISIHDTGPGVAPIDHASVFTAFQQASAGLRQGSGTGLGMPISKSLAEAHGGHLLLDSDVGEGATFTVVLPVKSESLTPLLLS